MASPGLGGGLADPVLSSGDCCRCKTINSKNARNYGFDFSRFPVTETRQQADSVPAGVEQWGTAQNHQHHQCLKPSPNPHLPTTGSNVLPNPPKTDDLFDKQLVLPHCFLAKPPPNPHRWLRKQLRKSRDLHLHLHRNGNGNGNEHWDQAQAATKFCGHIVLLPAKSQP